MAFILSQRSRDRLSKVDEKLVETVKKAIGITTVDFGVICGRRTVEEQKELVAKGASQTMHSKHIDGLAVDLMAYIKGRGSWELSVYDEVAEAMQLAAIDTGAVIRWGAAWNIPDIRKWEGSMEAAMNFYIDTRRGQGHRPFIDAPHFEINRVLVHGTK
jgi:peptidoglycan L-alanyl-D-glutamate endopeptidase CwlK